MYDCRLNRLLLLVIQLGFVSSLLAGEIPIVKPEQAGLSSKKLAKVDRVMESFVANGKLAGGIVIVAHQGKIGYFNTYGHRNVEASEPMTRDTIFRIYSMTKSITTAAALILYEQGKLDLDAPVYRYIPVLKDMKVYSADGNHPPKRAPTVRDLMRHTAGIDRGGSDPVGKMYRENKVRDAKDLQEMADRISRTALKYEPGTDWYYSLSISLLGLVIENISGQSLDRFFAERIFKPLDMTDTGFFVPANKVDRFAANYRRGKDGKLKLVDDPQKSKYLKKPTLLSGGGGLVSTARDYMRFLMMILNDGELLGARILKPSSVKLMKTDQLPKEAFPIYFGDQVRHGTGFTLGFSVSTADTEWDPAGRIGEFGWGGAASTHYWCSPKDDLIVVTLEQTVPYNFDTEFAVKGLIYDSIIKK